MGYDSHSLRVSQISRMLADAGGLGNDAALVEVCALLHDIGKQDVPPELLSKPGKLTADEFEAVKQHARQGAQRIHQFIDVLMVAAIIARFHHERWSGGGYEGLAGECIHPFARIVAVADVFDALMSRRPYKEPWQLKDALDYVQENAGTQFDPYWASILLTCKSDLAKLYVEERK